MSRPPTDETAISAAFRKAKEKREREALERLAQRRAQTEERLEMARQRSAAAKDKPKPQRPDWDGEISHEEVAEQAKAVATKLAAPGTPERSQQMRDLARLGNQKRWGNSATALQRIAQGQSPDDPPPQRYREPSVSPPAPHDPRVINGTLAPSPRVAEAIRSAKTEDDDAPKERPLQTEAFPPEVLRTLETGSPDQIRGGRDPETLRGIEREAYEKALARERAEALSGRGPRLADRDRPRSILGAALFDLRSQRGWTLEKVAKMAGLSIDAVKRIAVSPPGNACLPRDWAGLARAFGLTEEALRRAGEALQARPAVEAAPAAPAPAKALQPARTQAQQPQTPKEVLRGRNPRHLAGADRDLYYKLLGERSGKARRQNNDARQASPGRLPYQDNMRRLMLERGLTATTLAQGAGLHLVTIKKMVGGPGKGAFKSSLEKIAKALGVTLRELTAKPKAPPREPAASAPVAQATQIARTGWVEVPEVEAEVMTSMPVVIGPRPEIEKGIPVPAFFLSADMYRFDELDRGDSIKAECPFGMDFDDFCRRLASMLSRQQKARGHWYVTEASPDRTFVRFWRVV